MELRRRINPFAVFKEIRSPISLNWNLTRRRNQIRNTIKDNSTHPYSNHFQKNLPEYGRQRTLRKATKSYKTLRYATKKTDKMKTVIYAVTTFIMMSSPVTLCHRTNTNSDKNVMIQKMTDLRTCFTIAWNELFGIIPEKELQKFLPKVCLGHRTLAKKRYLFLLHWCWWQLGVSSWDRGF